jgi:hypothetical protein
MTKRERNPFEDAARGRDTTGAKSKPRFNIAEQVRILGADSLLPPAKPKKAKKRVTKSKPKRAKKRSKPVKPKPRKPMPAGGLHPRVGRPLAANVDTTLAAVQPWLDLKPPVSRSTWFRRQAAEKEDAGE